MPALLLEGHQLLCGCHTSISVPVPAYFRAAERVASDADRCRANVQHMASSIDLNIKVSEGINAG